MQQEKLAIHGGAPVKTTPYGSGKRFGLEEAKELLEALDQNTLFYHQGKKVKQFLRDFGELYGVKYSVAASSGTAAIHVALGAAGVTVGDEVVTGPITDQGTLIGILYQNAVPVFADLDPNTYGLDPSSIESRITSRTKAIVVVHLAGNPCDMDPIMDIARRHGLKVIEDCAQSYMTRYKGRLVGTIGDYGCFSTNDFKHMSTGDGGMVLVNSGDEADYQRTHAFADKNYMRFESTVVRDLSYLAPNYRMTELQGAVGIAQLKKLPLVCERRHSYGDRLTAGIADLPGIAPHRVADGNYGTYWFYMLRVDEAALGCTRDQFSEALKGEGVSNGAGYIKQAVYMQPLFQRKTAYPGSHFPFELYDVDYKEGLCPEAEAILRTAIVIPVNEFYTDTDLADTITGIRKVALHFGNKEGREA
ncbi:DegT/DnrJ/EryC1/StrS family aminotransferase [Paenibacillus cymbidii]|uniref:DegT/DnrJ/EryC1/StrS family aminotransferase n=1 Tax=Paenibacillus cymbidii TaxID=1639034 RepID=UPI001080E794|nr:DegT/DnrJ/EryC1/StrS family aminotransferase [Paenibacillus cymbidii]